MALTTVIAPDVSYFQPKVTNALTRKWLIFRLCDGDFLDPNAAANAAWCRESKAATRIYGWMTYVVWRPGKNAAILKYLDAFGRLDEVEIDVESWPNKSGNPTITGDHSEEINELADAIAARVGKAKTWIYGNLGDLDSLAPSRRPWLNVDVAAYRDTAPTGVANMRGWQYTNGQVRSGSRPLSSAPFGACDHNELYLDLDLTIDLSLLGGLLSDLTVAQQEEALTILRTLKANQGLTAGQQQNSYNRLIQIQTILGRLQTAQSSTSTAEATQIAAVMTELRKLEAAA